MKLSSRFRLKSLEKGEKASPSLWVPSWGPIMASVFPRPSLLIKPSPKGDYVSALEAGTHQPLCFPNPDISKRQKGAAECLPLEK